MNIKNILALPLIIGACSCQPEQKRWPIEETPSSTLGSVVFEALSKSTHEAKGCVRQKESFLAHKKNAFIDKFDYLIEIFTPEAQDNKNSDFIKFLKEQEDFARIQAWAHSIEKTAAILDASDIALINSLLSMPHHDFERLLLALIHDPKSALLAQEPQNLPEILENSLRNIDIMAISQVITESLGPAHAHNWSYKAALLAQKFCSKPKLSHALVELLENLFRVYPRDGVNLESFDINKLLMLKQYSFVLDLDRSTASFFLGTMKIFSSNSLLRMADTIINDEKIYQTITGNIKTLLEAGVIDDFVDLFNHLQKYKYLFDEQQNKQLVAFLELGKKLFPRDLPILEAPIVVIGRVLLSLFSARIENKCSVAIHDRDLASLIESWSENLVSFMRDQKNGLSHFLSLIRQNL